jgi:hypothetical protein
MNQNIITLATQNPQIARSPENHAGESISPMYLGFALPKLAKGGLWSF